MSERLVAWGNLTSAARAFSTSENKETRKTLSQAARAWAAVETPKREATPKKEATGARSAVAGDGPLVRFGRNKGQRVASLSQGDLDWYIRALRESVDDPTRAKFRAQNEAHLAECEALDPGVQPDVDEDIQHAHNARGW